MFYLVFNESLADESLFTYFLVYVDVIILTRSSLDFIKMVKEALANEFAVKDLEDLIFLASR